jgi:hypothetical protein
MKKIINPVIQTIIAILYITSIYVITHYDQKRTLHCGELINKGSVHRYKRSEDLYITMRFDKLGVRVLEVGPQTYFGTEMGERVCFELTENQEAGDTKPKPSTWQFLLMMLLIAGTVYYAVLLARALYAH